MKTLKLTVLLATMLIMNGCNKQKDETFPFYQHLLWISFQDATGSDLVTGIGFDYWVTNSNGLIITGGEDEPGGTVKSELFSVEYVYEDGIPNPWKPEPKPGVIYVENHPEIGLRKGKYYSKEFPMNVNYDYLMFDTKSLRDERFPFAEKIIIRLKCSYIFGDDEVHDIITWWKPYIYENRDSSIYGVCYRIEFGGKEFLVEIFENAAVATIILDK